MAGRGKVWRGEVWRGMARQGEARFLGTGGRMIETVECKITGLSALLMHAYPLVPVEAIEKKTPEQQAEFSAYRHPETRELYLPAIALQRALVAGAAYSKGKGRANLVKPTAACLQIDGEYLRLGTKEYTIDSRPVVIPATKGRVLRHRPRIDRWSVTFTLSYDDTLLSAKQVRQIVDDTGKNVGVLDFRPEKKGPFGRFIVDAWRDGGN